MPETMYLCSSEELTAIGSAIRAKLGESDIYTVDEMPGKISSINEIDEPNENDEVLFIDYDGKLIYSYTASEFSNLTDLPANPSHTGLVSQGWNWTLADAKAQVNAMGSCIIGQNYTTDDGSTRIYIDIDILRPTLTIKSYTSGTLTVDWGDGNSQNISHASGTEDSHTYSASGSYVVKISSYSSGATISFPTAATFSSTGMRSRITKVEIGSNMRELCFTGLRGCRSYSIPTTVTSFAENAFNGNVSLRGFVVPSGVTFKGRFTFSACGSLEFVSLPKTQATLGYQCFYYTKLKKISLPTGLTSLGDRAFQSTKLKKLVLPDGPSTVSTELASGLDTLEEVVIPDSYTSINASAFYNCTSLLNITLPDNLTTIGNNAFYLCQSIEKIIVPDSVTSIGNTVFAGSNSSNLTWVKEYHFLSNDPPVLGTGVFNNSASDKIIYVPYSADHSILTAYQTATNWVSWASYMQEEPQ